MSSSSSVPETSAGPATAPSSRPPGGTTRSHEGTGAKTPRRVQWASPADQKRDDPRTASTHGLDEHGLNPHTFSTLTSALQRHQLSPLDPAAVPGPNVEPAALSGLSAGTSPGTTSGAATPPLAPTRDVPGENFIDADESAGLPGTTQSATQSAASAVMRARRCGVFDAFPSFRGGLRARVDAGAAQDSPRPGAQPRRGLFGGFGGRRQDSGNTDVEKDAESALAAPRQPPGLGMRGGGGVLSALLTLYDSNGNNSVGGTNSTVSPAGSSPRGSFELSVDEEAYTRQRHAQAHTHLYPHLHGGSRPAPQRNGAGVFGALIASTGNIAGAAAPVNTTLAPDIKRPGYHLSRYSLDGTVDTNPRSRNGPRTPSRPQSMLFDPPLHAPSLGAEPSSSPGSEGSPSIQYQHEPSWDQSSATTGPRTPGGTRRAFPGVLKDLPLPLPHFRGWGASSGPPSVSGSPLSEEPGYFQTADAEKQRDWAQAEERERKRVQRRRRKKAEVFITRHVAEVLARQEFILKLARAMMMFGGPSHRLQAQIAATARVLDVALSCMYLPDVMLISFDDATTGTSNVKLIRQGSALDLEKLQDAYALYWKVIHDDVSVKDASEELDALMRKLPFYTTSQLVLIGGFCSSAICSVSFSGSFIDCLVVFPLGALLVAVQLLSVRNELYSNVFEITIATLLSFISAALAATHKFCYSAVASSSVVLILPGFIVLSGSLEISNRNIASGAVRLCYALMYALFLGFGLAMGAEIFEHVADQQVYGPEDYSCAYTHDAHGPWWQRTPSMFWAFLTVPMYSLFLSMRQQAPYNRRELILLIVISCAGWVTNHFTGKAFPNRNDIPAAVGAFAVGVISNAYGRIFKGNAFVVMITGILFQLPSGLGNGGLLTFASEQTSGQSSSTSYLSGFNTALQLISVALGLTVGLGISLVVVHPIQSRKRASGVFSL